MAKIDIFVCGRCGDAMEPPLYNPPDGTLFLSYRGSDQFDLCTDCQKSLQDWFHKKMRGETDGETA